MCNTGTIIAFILIRMMRFRKKITFLIIPVILSLLGLAFAQTDNGDEDFSELEQELKGLSKNVPSIELTIPDQNRIAAIEFFSSMAINESLIEQFLKASGIKKFNLARFKLTEQNLLSIFYFTALTERGRKFLMDFIPKTISGEVVINFVSDAWANENFPRSSIPAFYSNGVIFIRKEVDLINILIYLIHEGTHSIDMVGREKEKIFHKYFIPDVDKKSKDYKKAAMIVIETEHMAYRATQVFLNEFESIDYMFKKAVTLCRMSKSLNGYPKNLKEFKNEMTGFPYEIPSEYVDEYFSDRDWEYYN